MPSRVGVEEYDILKQEIERLIGEINGKYTDVGWIPIHYIFRSLDRTELLGYYRTCEITLITPLKDGMNLVAKEYCACNLEGKGVLILSEFAGSAAELQDSALILIRMISRELPCMVHGLPGAYPENETYAE